MTNKLDFMQWLETAIEEDSKFVGPRQPIDTSLIFTIKPIKEEMSVSMREALFKINNPKAYWEMVN